MTIRAARIAALALTLLLAAAIAGLWPAGPGQPPPAAAHTPCSIVGTISITSTASTDKNYVTGDTITVRISFNSGIVVDEHTEMRLKIQVGANERTATVPAASSVYFGLFSYQQNLTSLTFNYQVVASDSDQDGITVAANALSGTMKHRHGDTLQDYLNLHSTANNTLTTAQSNHLVNSNDYDDDNDNLIDIRSLAQLNAVRWDLDGQGDQDSESTTNWTNYKAAFPAAQPRMGCPNTCTGYELRASLDLDTDGDGQTHTNGSGDSGDTYYNGGQGWTPIGGVYDATFDGNGHTIDNLFIYTSVAAGNAYTGLFRELGGNGVVTTLGVTNAYSNYSYPAEPDSGILVGRNNGAITAAYTTGSVRSTAYTGGLVGVMNSGSIKASYSEARIEATHPGGAGGLVGHKVSGSITASYYAGAQVAANNGNGGLVGRLNPPANITNSYWDKTPEGVPDTSAGSPATAGKTTAELQSPVGYTGIYATWNLNLDGQTGNDDPWDFGANNDYPVLKYGGHTLTAQGRTLKDYDDNNDGLIEITTLAQLDAIRYDLDGEGDQDSESAANWNQYRAAFPNAMAGMGCPLTDHDSSPTTPEQPTCTGYELRADLDFDTNGNGHTHTGRNGDGDDAYNNGGRGWIPIGGAYNATFDGNGHTIDNLFIKTTTADRYDIGLFRQLGGSSGVITALGGGTLTSPIPALCRRRPATAAFWSVKTAAPLWPPTPPAMWRAMSILAAWSVR